MTRRVQSNNETGPYLFAKWSKDSSPKANLTPELKRDLVGIRTIDWKRKTNISEKRMLCFPTNGFNIRKITWKP